MSTEEFVLKIYSEVARYFNLAKYPKITIRKVPGKTACAKGILKPSIDIDKAWATAVRSSGQSRDIENMVFIIAHELAHVKHGDNLFRFCLLMLLLALGSFFVVTLTLYSHGAWALSVPVMACLYWHYGIRMPERHANQTASEVLDIWRAGETDG